MLVYDIFFIIDLVFPGCPTQRLVSTFPTAGRLGLRCEEGLPLKTWRGKTSPTRDRHSVNLVTKLLVLPLGQSFPPLKTRYGRVRCWLAFSFPRYGNSPICLNWGGARCMISYPSIIFYMHTPPTLKPPFNPKTSPAPIIGNAFRSTLVIFLDSYIELYRLIWHGRYLI